jgi:hypothetical protein
MPFRLRSDAEKWFSEINGREPIKTIWDLYYFCLMVGLASGRNTDPVSLGLPTKEMVDYVVEDYKPAQRLLIGLLVTAELRKGGIDLGEKTSVREVFKRLVSTEAPSGLTEEGMRCMNAYASGGYEFMAEARDTKPNSPDEFLRDYTQLIDAAMAAPG